MTAFLNIEFCEFLDVSRVVFLKLKGTGDTGHTDRYEALYCELKAYFLNGKYVADIKVTPLIAHREIIEL